MRRILLALVALLVVAGIAYYQSVRMADNRNEQFLAGREAGTAQLEAERERVDSIIAQSEQKLHRLQDSLASLASSHGETIGKLQSDILQQERTIDSLRRVVTSLRKGKSTPAQSSRTGDRKHEILVYFRKKIDGLPSDLSAYERQIALAELKQETARRFGISVTELETIQKTAGSLQ